MNGGDPEMGGMKYDHGGTYVPYVSHGFFLC